MLQARFGRLSLRPSNTFSSSSSFFQRNRFVNPSTSIFSAVRSPLFRKNFAQFNYPEDEYLQIVDNTRRQIENQFSNDLRESGFTPKLERELEERSKLEKELMARMENTSVSSPVKHADQVILPVSEDHLEHRAKALQLESQYGKQRIIKLLEKYIAQKKKLQEEVKKGFSESNDAEALENQSDEIPEFMDPSVDDRVVVDPEDKLIELKKHLEDNFNPDIDDSVILQSKVARMPHQTKKAYDYYARRPGLLRHLRKTLAFEEMLQDEFQRAALLSEDPLARLQLPTLEPYVLGTEPYLYTYANEVEFLTIKEADAIVRHNMEKDVAAENLKLDEELRRSTEAVERKLALSRGDVEQSTDSIEQEEAEDTANQKEVVADIKSEEKTLEDAKVARQVRKLLKDLRKKTVIDYEIDEETQDELDEENVQLDTRKGLDKRPFHQKPLEHSFPYREILKIGRHTVVTKGGRINSVSCLSVIGDGNGTVGLGYGKASAQDQAVRNSMRDAMKNIVFLPRLEGRTISGRQAVKYGATKILLKGGPDGYGVRTKHKWYSLIKLFGYRDVLFKTISGRRNKSNMIKAMIKGFSKTVIVSDIQRATGKKLFAQNDIIRQQKDIKYTF